MTDQRRSEFPHIRLLNLDKRFGQVLINLFIDEL